MAANKTEKEYGEEENLKNREVDANKILNFHVSANIFLATLASWLYGGGSIGPVVWSRLKCLNSYWNVLPWNLTQTLMVPRG